MDGDARFDRVPDCRAVSWGFPMHFGDETRQAGAARCEVQNKKPPS